MTQLRLDPVLLLETTERLWRRIDERFGECGLQRVCLQLVNLASSAGAACERIRRPNHTLRITSGLIIGMIVVFAITAAWMALDEAATGAPAARDWRDIPTVGEAIVNELILLAAAIWFFLTLERKRKRDRVLESLLDLRTLAHLIDVHQLTKNPHAATDPARATKSSPPRRMSPFEVGRYLDYCSEMLSLTGKIAALYGDASGDTDALKAVNDLETLCIGLQRKIWQKIIILESRTRGRLPGATLLGEAEPEEEE